MDKNNKILALFLVFSLMFCVSAFAVENSDDLRIIDQAAKAPARNISASPAQSQDQVPPLSLATATPNNKFEDPLKYTLGPDDVVEITVMRHSEFSGIYPVNLEGKIQYKFVGDLDVSGLTKKQLEDKIRGIIANYVINPDVNVSILEYKSKMIYVLGEVGAPGKYYMRSETIPIREAVVQAGLPTLSAAMRKCRIITPSKNGKIVIKNVDLFSVLYGGNLKYNLDMHPGEVLYVPATIMAKIIRVISPVTQTVSTAAEGPSSVQTGRTATRALSTPVP
ncbi:MAG: polysaccharide export protein [Candidatus Omnitrophica bacterium]|nr:polysaccharide export protein [Candidatus Omnitrophota bacterium]